MHIHQTSQTTAEEHTISTLVDKPDIQLTRRRRKTVFFLTLVFQGLYKVNCEQSLLFLQKIFERANEKSDRKSKMAPENYLFLLLYIGPVLALPFSSSSHWKFLYERKISLEPLAVPDISASNDYFNPILPGLFWRCRTWVGGGGIAPQPSVFSLYFTLN